MLYIFLDLWKGFCTNLVFTNFIFYCGLFLTFSLYFVVPVKNRWLVLLIMSILYYSTWGLIQFLFIVLASITVYIGALLIQKAESKTIKRIILSFSITVLLVMLLYVKIGKLFFSENIIIPLGISYYTFSLIGYLADVYWRKEKAEHNFTKFLLFILYFPKILEGPIEKYSPLADELYTGHKFDYKQFCFGLQLMVYGAFKKLVVADRISILIDSIFSISNINEYGGALVIIGGMLRALHMYADFSGCMDMALGMSQAMGIKLTENFRHPFFSTSTAEFWRRWHITLGTWFKNYVYMPLVVNPNVIKLSGIARKRFGKRAAQAIMMIGPLYIVWILTGLWHGTGKGYIVWGLYYGTIIVFSTIFEPEIKKFSKVLHINTETKSWTGFRIVRTFLIFSFGRLITVSHLRDQLKKVLFDFRPWQLFDGTLFNMGLDIPDFAVMVIALFIILKISIAQEKGSVRESVAQFNIVFRWMLYLGAVFAVLIFGMYGPEFNASDFAYMQF